MLIEKKRKWKGVSADFAFVAIAVMTRSDGTFLAEHNEPKLILSVFVFGFCTHNRRPLMTTQLVSY